MRLSSNAVLVPATFDSPADVSAVHDAILDYRGVATIGTRISSLGIQTLSEKVLNPPNYSKLYPKHFLRRYLDP